MGNELEDQLQSSSGSFNGSVVRCLGTISHRLDLQDRAAIKPEVCHFVGLYTCCVYVTQLLNNICGRRSSAGRHEIA